MKKYIITDEQRTEILELIKKRSFLAARNALNQLEEFKENKEGKKGNGASGNNETVEE